MLQHRISNGVQHIARAQLALHFDGQTFAAVLIYQRKHPKRGSIMCAVLDKVIGPDMVFVLWPQPHARPIVQPEALSLRLFARDLQPLAPPYPGNPFVVHMPALSAQQCCDPPIAIPAILTRKSDDR